MITVVVLVRAATSRVVLAVRSVVLLGLSVLIAPLPMLFVNIFFLDLLDLTGSFLPFQLSVWVVDDSEDSLLPISPLACAGGAG